MLLQTIESQELGLKVDRIEDVRPWIRAAVQDQETLSCGQLNAIAYLLQVMSLTGKNAQVSSSSGCQALAQTCKIQSCC